MGANSWFDLGVLAAIFSGLSLKNKEAGRGMAIAGLVLGIITIIIGVIILIIWIIALVALGAVASQLV